MAKIVEFDQYRGQPDPDMGCVAGGLGMQFQPPAGLKDALPHHPVVPLPLIHGNALQALFPDGGHPLTGTGALTPGLPGEYSQSQQANQCE